MPVEEEARDEFTKGWYTEDEEGVTPELPEGVVSTRAEREAEEREEKAASEAKEMKEEATREAQGGQDYPEMDEDLDPQFRTEEDMEDKKEEIDYVPRKQWYSKRWARVLSPPEKRVRHLALNLCTPNGELDSHILGDEEQNRTERKKCYLLLFIREIATIIPPRSQCEMG